LSVVGSLTYELTAANAASEAAAGKSLADAVITPEVFVTIAIVMSIGIILGGVLCVVGLKKYSGVLKKKTGQNVANQTDGALVDEAVGLNLENREEILKGEAENLDLKAQNGVLKSGAVGSDLRNNADALKAGGFDLRNNADSLKAVGLNLENNADALKGGAENLDLNSQNANAAADGEAKADDPKQKKKKFNFADIGNIVSASVFIAMCSAYIGGAIGRAFGGFHIDSYTSVVPFISMLIAVGCMAILTKMQKKHAWLQSFTLSFSMLLGMVSAVPVSLILGAIF
jgi:hypothetical protein